MKFIPAVVDNQNLVTTDGGRSFKTTGIGTHDDRVVYLPYREVFRPFTNKEVVNAFLLVEDDFIDEPKE